MWWPLSSAAMLLLAAAAALALSGSLVGPTGRAIAAVWAVVAAVVGGGPLTELVLRLADRADHTDRPDRRPPASDAELLRGGAWIGALERAGITAAILLGSAEGVAIVLAVKGLGRYPELRAPTGQAAVAERFIVGTFTSVLWACACAGVAMLLVG
jgi:hypothetical protein